MCDSWSTLARDLVSARDINDVDDEVSEFTGVVGRKVVATGFDEEKVGIEFVVEVCECQKVY